MNKMLEYSNPGRYWVERINRNKNKGPNGTLVDKKKKKRRNTIVIDEEQAGNRRISILEQAVNDSLKDENEKLKEELEKYKKLIEESKQKKENILIKNINKKLKKIEQKIDECAVCLCDDITVCDRTLVINKGFNFRRIGLCDCNITLCNLCVSKLSKPFVGEDSGLSDGISINCPSCRVAHVFFITPDKLEKANFVYKNDSKYPFVNKTIQALCDNVDPTEVDQMNNAQEISDDEDYEPYTPIYYRVMIPNNNNN